MAVANSYFGGGHPCDNDAISAEDLLRISWQVASGMVSFKASLLGFIYAAGHKQ